MEVISHNGWKVAGLEIRAEVSGFGDTAFSLSCLESGIWRLILDSSPGRGTTTDVTQPQSSIPISIRQDEPKYVSVMTEQNEALAARTSLRLSSAVAEFLWSSTEFAIGRISPVTPFPRHPLRGEKEQGRLPKEGLAIRFWTKDKSRTYYGLGERVGSLAKQGGFWENWNTDVHHICGATDPLYQSHPLLLWKDGSGEFSGLFLSEARRSLFEIDKTEKGEGWLVSAARELPALYLLPGPDIESLLRQLAQLLGKAPLPPLWAFGYHHCRWSFENDAEVRSLAEKFRSRALPLEALWLDIGHLDKFQVFTFAKEKFPNPKDTFRFLHERNIRSVVIVNPCVTTGSEQFQVGKERNFFISDDSGEPLEGAVWTGPVVWPDFTNEEARAWWGEQYAFYIDLGVDGFWNDMNEPSASNWQQRTLPDGARLKAGAHADVHNLYGSLMAQATYEGVRGLRRERRPFVLTRSGYSGIQRHAWVWTGDTDSTWEHMRLSIPMLLNLGLSGVPFVGADIGGFYHDVDGELLTRSMWLGAFYPFMRNHAAIGTARQEPWLFEPVFESAIAEALRFRYRLLPYLYTSAKYAAERGVPLLRPMFFADPSDTELNELSDQFLCGDSLLVAPVLEPGRRKRSVYFPQGTWFDFWSGATIIGPGWRIIDVPLDRTGLFQRGGSAVPLCRTAEEWTETAYWAGITWRIAPGRKVSGVLFEDEGDGFTDTGRYTHLSGVLRLNTLKISLSLKPERFHEVELRATQSIEKATISVGSAELFWGAC